MDRFPRAAFWVRSARGNTLVCLTPLALLAVGSCTSRATVHSAREPSDGGVLHTAPTLEIRDSVLDAMLRLHFTANAPGAAVVVRYGERIMHRAAYGVASIATGEPITAQTPFYIGSVAKPLTATAVISLVARGRLAYGDSLGGLLPEFGIYPGITIAQLLTHTSGVPDYYQFIDWPRFRSIDNAGVLAMLREHAAPVFVPGERFGYSNSGYVLLAEVVAAVNGASLSRVLERDQFARAGMIAASSAADPPHAPVARALGYSRGDGGFRLSDVAGREVAAGRIVPFTFATVGAGGIFASADDLIRWEQALSAGALLPRAHVRAMQSPRTEVPDPGRLAPREHYGYGWYISRRDGREWIWHSGNFAGFAAVLVTVPSEDIAVVVLSNVAETDAVGIGLQLVEEVLGRLARR